MIIAFADARIWNGRFVRVIDQCVIFILDTCLYLLALAYGEMCHDLDECDHVACSSAYELECLHGECTCTHSTLFWLDYNNQSYWFKLNDPHVSVTVPDV